ncbi:WD40 repeat-like protein [Acaromyces ingoldii]|uniref:WD40 repeat-like protein n=1 Tax=Acaromyces ingoldii TaxID=215250 RepID=A0A316YNH5_9BASI|nr:WD40 repeat-like protein [Acaromyces ingoldii]PWN90927.1 WD40 repeat-like protein [Acaromyces ingoldii]
MPKSPGRSLFGGSVSDTNLVDSLDSPNHSAYNVSPVKMESQRLLSSPRRVHRVLSKVPYKVLDAPELADDYYLNLVDWSSADVLGVGLGHCVYLWSAKTSGVTKLCDLKENKPELDRDKVMGISWSGQGNYLAVGTQNGKVQIWDPVTLKCIRTMTGHKQRVGALAWNEHILTSGSRDRSIYHRDVRVPQQSIRELKGHKQEVCGLKWNTMTNQLASGGNDNKLFVWDGLGSSALHQFAEHTAAVKAIAWSPHQQGLLASGGGTADMKIKYWNTVTGAKLSEVDTGSQVCNLAWSKTSNEIISTHGFSSGKVHNQVQIWRYPGMQQVASLTGHTMRVLYLAMSPDGETIVSGAGDETLRFWNLNTPAKKLVAAETSSTLNPFAKLR